MKYCFLVVCIMFVSSVALSQEVQTTAEPVKKEKKEKKKKKEKVSLDLTNAVIIGQMDKPQDRYSIEITLTEMLKTRQMATIPSLNIMKIGGEPTVLASDSVMQLLKSKGIDTYVLVSVRGYDRRFKVAQNQDSLEMALNQGSLFELYREDIVSVSFEFKFYRNGEFVFGDMVKCGGVSDRDQVMKKFRNKVEKRLDKKWR